MTEQNAPRGIRRAPRVLLIAGWSRSGSTLIDTILGSIEGVAAVGELRGLWAKLAAGTGSACGCGRPHRSCPFWSAVTEAAFGGLDERSAAHLAELEARVVRTRPRELAHIAVGARRAPGSYGRMLGDLYAAIAEISGADVVVDSSKSPAHVLEVVEHAHLDVRVLHLVRDPRAVAHSWSRRSIETFRFGPASSSLNWLVMNLAVETLLRPRLGHRLMLLRYEDFVAEPRASIAAICAWAGIRAEALPFAGDDAVALRDNHSVGGNPSRFRTGEVAIAADEEWAERMTPRDSLLATLPALPLMPRYGYRAIRS